MAANNLIRHFISVTTSAINDWWGNVTVTWRYDPGGPLPADASLVLTVEAAALRYERKFSRYQMANVDRLTIMQWRREILDDLDEVFAMSVTVPQPE